jgi:hypothetical protein
MANIDEAIGMSPISKTSGAVDRGGYEAGRPRELLERSDLTREEKLALLRDWELDLRERMVAEEENMPASEPLAISLDEVLDALRSLGAESQFRNVSTKHG